MIIDMSGTVTVIPDASGTVTKLHIRIIHIGDPANFTLSGIRSIITVSVHLFRRFLVIDDFRIIVSAFLAKELEQPSAAEQQIVQNSHHRNQIIREGRHNNLIKKERRINIGKPFDLHWNDEEKEHLSFREQSGEGKEHGKIDIGG